MARPRCCNNISSLSLFDGNLTFPLQVFSIIISFHLGNGKTIEKRLSKFASENILSLN